MDARSDQTRMIFRNTNANAGRTISVTPANSTNQHLCYGRIILNHEVNSVRFATSEKETGFIVLSGYAKVSVDGQEFELGQYDGLYGPRDSGIGISTAGRRASREFGAGGARQRTGAGVE